MGVCLPLPPEVDHPSVLQQRGTNLPHQPGDQGQLGQREAVKVGGNLLEDLQRQAAQGVCALTPPFQSPLATIAEG